jgi:hypothetical protein
MRPTKMRTSVARDLSILIWSRNLANSPVFTYLSAEHRLLSHHLNLTGHAGVDDFWFPRRIVALRIR